MCAEYEYTNSSFIYRHNRFEDIQRHAWVVVNTIFYSISFYCTELFGNTNK
uniref:Uncharacterized protein n=1 Tax=Oryza brachyantha TaxID=4533 RepID=J3LDN4_ORYBR